MFTSEAALINHMEVSHVPNIQQTENPNLPEEVANIDTSGAANSMTLDEEEADDDTAAEVPVSVLPSYLHRTKYV